MDDVEATEEGETATKAWREQNTQDVLQNSYLQCGQKTTLTDGRRTVFHPLNKGASPIIQTIEYGLVNNNSWVQIDHTSIVKGVVC